MDAGNEAASVAAGLLAFYREPALLRPRYLHREMPMPDGAIVLRFALGRFAADGPERIALPDRAAVQVAALAFVRQVCFWDRATHYQVLCLEPDAAPDEVKENYHLLIALIHPDRDDAGWPSGCAPRANRAYAVLSEAVQRAHYDAQLGKTVHEGAILEGLRAARINEHTGARHPRSHHRAPARFLARFAVVAGVVAALFVVQAWWVGGDASPNYSLLERAVPVAARLRAELPDPPRFLGTGFGAVDQLPRIEEPKRMASLVAWTPLPEPPAAAEGQPQRALPVAEAMPVALAAPAAPTPSIESRAPSIAKSVSEAPPPALRLAQAPATGSPSAAPPASAAPAPASAPAPGAPSRDQVEGLVTLLVSYYDAGDADRLVALFDPEQLGFWSGLRTRSAYSDFFGATRDRRLRIDRLSWHANGAIQQARGEAVVLAEYPDGRPRLERRVPVELDIVLRESQPRLARMVLFPLGQ